MEGQLRDRLYRMYIRHARKMQKRKGEIAGGDDSTGERERNSIIKIEDKSNNIVRLLDRIFTVNFSFGFL